LTFRAPIPPKFFLTSRAVSIPAGDVPLDGDNECFEAFVRLFVRASQRVHTFYEVNLGLRQAPYEVGQLADFPVMALNRLLVVLHRGAEPVDPGEDLGLMLQDKLDGAFDLFVCHAPLCFSRAAAK
jgi:hypothetical protein